MHIAEKLHYYINSPHSRIELSVTSPDMFDFDLIEETFDSRILSYTDTLSEIAKPGVSLARFGDSEIKMLSTNFSIGFQRFSPELQSSLHQVLQDPKENLLIGFPPVFRNEQWSRLWENHFSSTQKAFNHIPALANTAVSRPPCFSEIKGAALTGWKKVWDQKSVTIITGRGSRFQYYEELFGNSTSFEYIYAQPVDAFEQMHSIIKSVESGPASDVYLISLGPTATVLAYELAERGFKALDVGHLSASYAYWKGEGNYPEKMKLTQ